MTDRSSNNRPPLKKTLEFFDQILRRRVSTMAVFLQTLQADGFKVNGNAGVQRTRRRRVLFADLLQDAEHTSSEWAFSSEKFVKDDAHREYVGATIRAI